VYKEDIFDVFSDCSRVYLKKFLKKEECTFSAKVRVLVGSSTLLSLSKTASSAREISSKRKI
jgi:hypothetical protein